MESHAVWASKLLYTSMAIQFVTNYRGKLSFFLNSPGGGVWTGILVSPFQTRRGHMRPYPHAPVYYIDLHITVIVF